MLQRHVPPMHECSKMLATAEHNCTDFVTAGCSTSSPYVSNRLLVAVDNAAIPSIILLKGRVWAYGAFLSGPEYPISQEGGGALFNAAGLSLQPATTSQASTSGAGGGGGVASYPPLLMRMPCSLACIPGHNVTCTLDLGSLKSGIAGLGAPAELVLDELPVTSKEAGWGVEVVGGTTSKLSVNAGEKKSVKVKFMVPPSPVMLSLLALGSPEVVELRIGGTLKGGMPAVGAGAGANTTGARISLRVQCLLLPASAGPQQVSK